MILVNIAALWDKEIITFIWLIHGWDWYKADTWVQKLKNTWLRCLTSLLDMRRCRELTWRNFLYQWTTCRCAIRFQIQHIRLVDALPRSKKAWRCPYSSGERLQKKSGFWIHALVYLVDEAVGYIATLYFHEYQNEFHVGPALALHASVKQTHRWRPLM